MLGQGQLPDVISTDLYSSNVDGPVYDLPTTLSKFLALGMGLSEVIAAATEQPAAIIGKGDGLGRLEVGGPGDVTILELVEGEFELADCHGQTLTAGRRLVSAGTIRAGRLMET
jgi:dihydroorotase